MNSESQALDLTTELIHKTDKTYDPRYLKKYEWPDKLKTGDIREVAPKELELMREAFECFIHHNALVDQIQE